MPIFGLLTQGDLFVHRQYINIQMRNVHEIGPVERYIRLSELAPKYFPFYFAVRYSFSRVQPNVSTGSRKNINLISSETFIFGLKYFATRYVTESSLALSGEGVVIRGFKHRPSWN